MDSSNDSVSAEDFSVCISILQKLKPSDFSTTTSELTQELSLLKSEGIRVFGRVIKEELFGESGVIAYLEKQRGVSKKINKLTRLHEQVTKAHASIVEENSCAGINALRETKTQEVNSLGLAVVTTEYAAIALSDSMNFNAKYLVKDTGTMSDNDSLPVDISLDQPPEDEQLPESGKQTQSQTQTQTQTQQQSYPKQKSNYDRKKEFKFDVSKVRGMYEDVDVSASTGALRRRGSMFLVPRGGNEEGGWLSFVVDSEDAVKRACSQRTVEIIRLALAKMDLDLLPGQVREVGCTYVVGERQQRWAYLGGAIEGLSGETAISVVLELNDLATAAPTKRIADAEASVSWTSIDMIADSAHIPPIGSFRRYCNICKQPYARIHFFYHQLCQPCGDLNYDKRVASADMTGRLCLVTGGRVRIGYQIVLKLLRAGARVIATTRWVYDAALRYSHESDFNEWKGRLVIDKVELSDLVETERYCAYLEHSYSSSSLDVLINNAAQTITRPTQWTDKMNVLEYSALQQLSAQARELLSSPWMQEMGNCIPGHILRLCEGAPDPQASPESLDVVDSAGGVVTVPLARRIYDPNNGGWLTYDESGQPLDLSGVNSWSKRLADIDVSEMAQTMAVNAMAPFLLCSRLKALLTPLACPDAGGVNQQLPRYSHIVNVTALEGKFNVGKKSGGHPHTNMSKAALNMLTLTASRAYASDHILMNSVDTGWVTDMAPRGLGAQAKVHETFVGPPLDDLDGASRVLDPVFKYVMSNGLDISNGHFWKDYMKSNW